MYCLCWLPAHLAGSDPNYISRFWQTGDGLPHSSVTAVLQSHAGYIWLGTRVGLARFDGERFTAFDASNTPQMQSPHVTCLFESDDGALWIGHETGELTCYQDGKFRTVPVRAAWHGGRIFAIGADRAGDIWLLNQDGELARVKDGALIPSPPTRTTYLLAMTRNPNGSLWIQRDNDVSALEDGRLEGLKVEGTNGIPYIQGICASRDGGLWVMAENRLRKWKDEKWIGDIGPAPWGWSPAHTIVETRGGQLVAATVNHGLYIVSPGQGSLHFSRTNGFSDDWITSLHEDREGNVWAGTGNGGLAMLRAGNITAFNPPDQWQGRSVLSVAPGPDGAVWIGSEGAGLYRLEGENWTNFKTEAGIANHYVWSVTQDAHGQLWAGSWGAGLFGQTGTQFEALPPELRDLALSVPALLPASNGGLLIGTSIGLLQYCKGKTTWLARKPEMFAPDVRAIREAPDGSVWFGMSGGGLGLWKQGTVRQFRRSEGLSSDFVQCLRLEPDGTLWIGTFGGGLNRFKNGHFVAITKKQGLPSDIICDIENDELGNYWISSHGGIVRVSKNALEDCAEGRTSRLHCMTYGLSDGLPTLQCSGGFQPAGCKTADGRLWFPTSKGLVAVDPRNVKSNPLPPPVIIEKVLMDDHVLAEAPQLTTPLRIAPGRHRFEFQFSGLSFAAPEKVRFRYKLEGLEDEAVEVQSPRRANYSYIPPGDYHFHISACNNDGVWNDTGAELGFVVLPYFWQTWWFRTIGGAMTAMGGGVIVWLDSRRRMRRKVERLERQQAIERERARIAKDIHDDLGAGLTRISMFTESVSSEQVSPPQAVEALNRIYATTHEMTLAMDEIVWAVNPKHDTLDSLASYLGKFVQDFLEIAGVRCRLDMPLQLPNWRLEAELRHNVFLALKESLNNVLRHAAATEVRVTLTLGTGSFAIAVEDNGKGFVIEPSAAAARRAPHRNGLANMQQRLTEIGGKCEITSVPGQGTCVKLHVLLNPGAS
jgi:signal transduction histidine kinase/ligand-binding sensor domain-containing protein